MIIFMFNNDLIYHYIQLFKYVLTFLPCCLQLTTTVTTVEASPPSLTPSLADVNAR